MYGKISYATWPVIKRMLCLPGVLLAVILIAVVVEAL
jgi:hypothetical protein